MDSKTSGNRKSTSASHYIFFAVQTMLVPHKDNSCIVLSSTLFQATFKTNWWRECPFFNHILWAPLSKISCTSMCGLFRGSILYPVIINIY